MINLRTKDQSWPGMPMPGSKPGSAGMPASPAPVDDFKLAKGRVIAWPKLRRRADRPDAFYVLATLPTLTKPIERWARWRRLQLNLKNLGPSVVAQVRVSRGRITIVGDVSEAFRLVHDGAVVEWLSEKPQRPPRTGALGGRILRTLIDRGELSITALAVAVGLEGGRGLTRVASAIDRLETRGFVRSRITVSRTWPCKRSRLVDVMRPASEPEPVEKDAA